MTVTLPDPVPLDPPPGDPAALAHLVERVAGTSFLLAVLQADLQGPAGTAPGWEGADAAAAAAQLAVVVDLAGEVSAVLCTAAGRLSLHRDRLEDVRSRLRVLRAQQEEDHAAAWARLSVLPDPVAAMQAELAPAVAVIEEVRAAEERRRREHATLIEDLAEDAVATRRVLAECSAVVGGTGRAGDSGRAVAHLALLLPGWGEAELTARGAELAAAFGRLPTPEEREALAREAIAFAHLPAFASALLAGMGVDDVGTTLFLLGEGDLGESSAALLASALGAAVRSGAAADPVGQVLDAIYVDPGDLGLESDAIAVGMGAVLAAGLRRGGGGPAPSTAVAWGRQLLARETALAGDLRGSRAVDRAYGPGISPAAADPVQLVAQHLAQAVDPSAAAALLGDEAVWQRLLERPWDDDAAELGNLVTRAGAEQGGAGDVAVRAGLASIGAGLFDGDSGAWTVDRDNVAAVAGALGGAVAAHVGVAVDALWVGVDDSRCVAASDALRGLGYLTVDRAAAGAVGQALHDWTRSEAADEVVADGMPLVSVAVPSAYLAAQEYGQRLSFALDTYEAKAEADHRALVWNATVGLAGEALPGAWGSAAGLLTDYAAILFGADGTWADEVDGGLVFDSGAAIEEGLADTRPERALAAAEIARQARGAFDRTAGALGDPMPVLSPDVDFLQPVIDAFLSEAGTRREPRTSPDR